MNFSTFTKISSGNLIYFRNESPIENVGTLKFYRDNASGTFLKKEFRWSFDRNYWSSWETLNIGNIAKVNTGNNRYLFFEIKYTMTSPTAGKVTSFAVEYIVNPNETYAPAVEDVTNMDNNHILPDGCNDLGGTTKTFKTIEITDAETLCGKSCDYYLWRPNHQGTQPISSVTGLQNILNNLTSGLNDSITNALNVDGSGSGVFYQKSGKNLIFKKINPGPGSYIIESDGIITIGVDASIAGGSVYDSSLDPSTTMPSSVGGIPAGTTVSDLNGDTISSLWDALLFPTAYPTLTAPNNSFSSNAGSLQEIGANINIIFTASFSQGSISPQYSATSPYRSGLPNTYTYTGTGIAGSVSSISLSDVSILTGYNVISGIQSWANVVSYDAGVQPYDSKGNIYNSPLSAGTTSAKTVSVEGVYPLFGTTVNINTLTKQSLVSMISGNNIEFNMVPESGGSKQKFEIPTAWTGAPTNRPLVGVQQFNTVSNAWEYPGGSAAASLLLWTTSGTTESVQGNTINYTQYTYNGTDRSSVQIRLIF